MRPRALALVLVLGALAAVGCEDNVDPATVETGFADGQLTVVGTDTLQFQPSDVTVPVADLVVQLVCDDAAPHDITLAGSDETVVSCSSGQTSTEELALEPGTYTYYCSVPGHQQAGMTGQLTVEG